MTHPPRETLRAYVDADVMLTKRLLVEAHLALCPTCPRLVAEGRDIAPRLPEASVTDEIELPSFDRVWRAVEQMAAKRHRVETAVLPSSLLTAFPDPSGWRWIRVWPRKVKFALLARDADTGSELYLSHFAPGSSFPRHRHIGCEETVILFGGYQDAELHVEVGDWVVGVPGTEHAPTTRADEECWCLSRIDPPGLRFSGWRGWLQRLLQYGGRTHGRRPASERSLNGFLLR